MIEVYSIARDAWIKDHHSLLGDDARSLDAVIEAIEKAIEDEWITVSDSLPKDTQPVLCANANGNRWTGQYVANGSGWYDSCGNTRKPTHWMELPPFTTKRSV